MNPVTGDDPETLDLETLRGRKSLKWTAFERDVLPAWVAETDLRPPEAVRDALFEAIEIGDTGYPNPGAAGLDRAFAGFAE